MLHHKLENHPLFPTPSSRIRGRWEEPLPSPVPSFGPDSDYEQDPLDCLHPEYAESDMDGAGSVDEAPIADHHFLHFGSETDFHATRFLRDEPNSPMTTITEMSRSTVSLSAVGPSSLSERVQETSLERVDVPIPSGPVTPGSIFDSDSASEGTFGGSDDESNSDETETPFPWEDHDMFVQAYATHAALHGAQKLSSEDNSIEETGPLRHLHALVRDAMCQKSVLRKQKAQKQPPGDLPIKHPFASSSPTSQRSAVTSASLPISSDSFLDQRPICGRHKIYTSDSELPTNSPVSQHASLKSESYAPAHRVRPGRANTTVIQQRAATPLVSPPYSAPPLPTRHTRAANTCSFVAPVPTHGARGEGLSHKCSRGHDARTTIISSDRSRVSARPCCFFQFSDEEERPRPRVPISFGWLGRRRSSKDSSEQHQTWSRKHPHENGHTPESFNVWPDLTLDNTHPDNIRPFSSAMRRSVSAAPVCTVGPPNRHESKPSTRYILPPSELAGRKRTLKKPPPLDLTGASYRSVPKSPQQHILRPRTARPERHNRDSVTTLVASCHDDDVGDDTDSDDLTIDAPFAPSAWCYARDGFSMPLE